MSMRRVKWLQKKTFRSKRRVSSMRGKGVVYEYLVIGMAGDVD